MPDGTPPGYSRDGTWWWDGERWVAVSSSQPLRRPPAWLAMAGSLLVLLVAGSLLTGMIALSGPWQEGWNQAVHDAQPGVHNLQACAMASFDQQSRTCKHNQASSAFQTDRMVCIARVIGNVGQQVTSTVTFQGHEVLRSSKALTSSSSSDVLGISIAPGKALPGGDWSCRFSLNGRSQSINFQLNGPTGSLLYSSACDLREIVSANHLICKQDRDTITGARAIACTAVVSGAENRVVEVDLVYGGGQVQPFTRSDNGTVSNQLVPVGLALQASDIGTSGALPAGHYTCRWLIDGRQVGQKDFLVTA
jgi:hypothetical protein